MERGVVCKPKLRQVDFPFAVIVLDKRRNHCLQYAIYSFDRICLRVIWGFRRVYDTALFRKSLYFLIDKLRAVVGKQYTRRALAINN